MVGFRVGEVSRKAKPIEPGSRSVVFWAGGLGGLESHGCRVQGFFGGDEKALKLMDAQLCELLKGTELYTLNGWIVWCVNYLSEAG